MAKIIQGIVGQISGSIGTATYAHNRYGLYVRARGIPVNPQSARQTVIRGALADLAQRWLNTLTAAQRSGWETYGANVAMTDRFGAVIHLSGMQHYIRSNSPRIVAGLDRVDAAPVIFTLPETDTTFSIGVTADDQKVAITFDDTATWCDTDGAALLVSCGKEVSITRNYYGSPWRFAGAIEGDSVSPPTTGVELDAPYVYSAANRVYAFARLSLADGRLSSPFRSDAVVAAS